MSEFREGGANVVAIFGGFMFLAVIAVVVSNRANTANIIGSLGKATGGVIGTAISPVTGAGGGPGQNSGPPSAG
jgi:hypothetical protein